MQFQTGIGTASELHRTAVLFGTGTAGIAKTAGIRTTSEPHRTAVLFGTGTAGIAKTAGVGTAGTAIEKSWNRPCLLEIPRVVH